MSRRKRLKRAQRRAVRNLPSIREVRAARRGVSADHEIVETPNPRMSLYDFVVEAWHIIHPPNKPMSDGEYLRKVCGAIERQFRFKMPRRLAVNIPPGFTKSLMGNVFLPAWLWGPAQMPWFQTLHITNSLELATRDSVTCRSLMLSEWYQNRWGSAFDFSSDMNLKTRYTNNQNGKRFTKGTLTKATGEHVDGIVIDDLITVTEATRGKRREASNEWTRVEVSSRFNDEDEGILLVMGQKVHAHDIFGVIDEGYLGDGWGWVILPNEYEPPDPEDNRRRVVRDTRTVPGELLDPNRVSEEATPQIKRRLGSRNYDLQYQQKSRAASDGILKRDWWRRYKNVPAGTVHVLVDPTFGAGTDDAGRLLPEADGEAKLGSRVSVTAVMHVGRRLYVLEDSTAYRGFHDQVKATERMALKYNAQFVHVEGTAFGSAIVETLKAKFPALRVNKFAASEGKEAKAWAVEPWVEDGAVYIPEDDAADWVVPWLDEVSSFPKGDFDDRLDNICTAILKTVAKYGFGGHSETQVR